MTTKQATKWTPGPWKFLPFNKVDIVGPSNESIAKVIGLWSGDVEEEEHRANARLIAQAPAMAELLQRIFTQPGSIDKMFECKREAERILAAINGAE